MIVSGMTVREITGMTKTDEFIKKIEQLDPHLEVTKYRNVYMIIWYVNDKGLKMPFVTFTHTYNDIPVVETDCTRFGKDDLALYSKIIKLCTEYFSFLYEEEQ